MEFNQIQNDLDKFSSIKRRPILLGIVVAIILSVVSFHEKVQPLPDWILFVVIPMVIYLIKSMDILADKKNTINSMRRG